MALVGNFINLNANADTLTLRAADTSSASTIQGGQGADTLTVGVYSASFLNGNKDNDTISLQAVASTGSTMRGGAGNDTINALGAAAAFNSGLVAGDSGTDNISDGGFNITLTSTTVQGNAGNDTINFAATNNGVTARGGANNDTLSSGTGADTLLGDNGADSIAAGNGADVMTGGTGIDTFNGTNATGVAASAISVAAATTFQAGQILTFANGIDRITDWEATDRLDLAGATATVTGIGVANNVNAVLNYGLSGAFNATAGTFTIAADNAGSDTLMMTGVNGAVTANASFIVLQGLTNNVGVTVI
jgi:Ca2+-binding RTX toxin-like protein